MFVKMSHTNILIMLMFTTNVIADETNEEFSTPSTTTTKRTKAPWDRFALFYCERMKECNVIPKDKICAVEVNTKGALWFENICTMWKVNCLQIAMLMPAPESKCAHSEGVISNRQFDTNPFQPLGYNPYYTFDKLKISL